MSYSSRRQSTTRGSRGYRGGGSYHTASRPVSRGPKKDYINPERFIQSAKPVAEVDDYVPMHQFSDFDITPLLKTNLAAKGYQVPSPIQDQTIPLGLAGKDVVGIANTGTGKTAAFAIPVLQQLMLSDNKRALIMAPTRELAQQIEEQCKLFAKGSGLSGALLIGGVSMGPQLRSLRDNPQIVIGTPGRIKDHSQQGSLQLSKFNIIVLDEVDRMLDMGFIGDITHILNLTAPVKQSLFFSATLDSRVRTVIDSFSANPVHISVKTGDTSDNVDQNVVTYAGSGDKLSKLHDLLTQKDVVKALVFDDTHRSVEKLTKELQLRGFASDAIHGGKSQGQRQRALSKFKASEINILVATDVAARGIDVIDISHVINYSAPNTYGDYVHRIGRAGRAGQPGYALTFIEK